MRAVWFASVALAASGCGSDDGPRVSSTAAVSTSSDDAGSASGSDDAATSVADASASSDGPSMSSTVASSADATTEGDAGPGDDTSTGAVPTSTGDTGTVVDVCDGIAGESLMPPSVCDGPSGNTTTEVPANGLFATSWFGCYLDDDGTIHEDPFDNCEFACGNQGLCPGGQSGPECEAGLRWFAADADRYGCGGRIRVTNCDNGNAVVLVTLDRGPNCNSVEMDCAAPVLDMSHDAMVYLFDGATYGGCDHQAVVVEAVDDTTPLGPV